MKNYYDELEVSKTASKEVIEKVYKVLAKKYHPDTTKELDKQAAEEKFKIISEAYEVLSDDEKRKKYDVELEQFNPTISYQEYMNVVNQRDNLNNALNNLKNQFYQSNNYNVNTQSNINYQNQNQYQYQQRQYNQHNTNSNTGYNPQHNVNQNTNPKKKTYYYTATGKPASSFDYFKYIISNVGFYILIIIVLYLAFKSLFTHGFSGLLS